jgi:3-oxoacyl-(acyl-carrier-protein) synthase
MLLFWLLGSTAVLVLSFVRPTALVRSGLPESEQLRSLRTTRLLAVVLIAISSYRGYYKYQENQRRTVADEAVESAIKRLATEHPQALSASQLPVQQPTTATDTAVNASGPQ